MELGIRHHGQQQLAQQWRKHERTIKLREATAARTTTRRSALCSHVELRGSNAGPIPLKLPCPKLASGT